MTPNDFDLYTPYQKRPNERVVIVTSGSALMGVGVANNEQANAYRLSGGLFLDNFDREIDVMQIWHRVIDTCKEILYRETAAAK